MPAEPTDTELVAAFLARVEGLSTVKATHRAADIGHMDVSRWRRGEWKRLSGKKREALKSYLQSADGGVPVDDQDDEEEQGFADVLQVTRYLGGVAPPGEEKNVKLDILEGIKRTILIRESKLPNWWYTLRGKIEDDAL